MSWLPRRKYLALLLSLALLLVTYPVSHCRFPARLAYDLLLTLVVLGAIRAVFPTTRLRLLGLIFGAPLLVVSWTGYVLPAAPLNLGFHALVALFLGLTTVMILRAIFREA